MKYQINLLLSFFIAIIFSCQNEPFEGGFENNETIEKESKLFDLLKRSTTNTNNPLDDINCIKFEYPIKVNLYNSDKVIIGSQTINNETDFSLFLNSISSNQLISVSYPMETTLNDGSIKVIDSNSELQEAIEACENTQIIDYCEGIFCSEEQSKKVVWRIDYKINEDNKYVSAVFEPKNDKTLLFHYNGETLNGTWYFYRWNNETHINISLEGNSQIANDWNIDRKCTVLDEIIIKNTNEKEIILKRNWDITNHVFEIGDTGTGNGIVFYDKGHFSHGWRYLEVANEDLDFFEWGCSESTILDTFGSEIGQGHYNTAKITNFHDNLTNYYNNPNICNSNNNGTVAAQKTMLYVSSNGFSDWYLPTKDELSLIYQNLHSQSLGNLTNSIYWSSTQIDEFHANAINFSNGAEIISPKIPISNNLKTRAIRSF